MDTHLCLTLTGVMMRTLIQIGWLASGALMLAAAWAAGDAAAGVEEGQVGRVVQWIGRTIGGGRMNSASTRDLALAVTFSTGALMVVAACVRIALIDLSGRDR